MPRDVSPSKALAILKLNSDSHTNPCEQIPISSLKGDQITIRGMSFALKLMSCFSSMLPTQVQRLLTESKLNPLSSLRILLAAQIAVALCRLRIHASQTMSAVRSILTTSSTPVVVRECSIRNTSRIVCTTMGSRTLQPGDIGKRPARMVTERRERTRHFSRH